MGGDTVTIQKVEVVKTEPEKNLIYLDGPVPGASGSWVVVTETVKALKRRKAGAAPIAEKTKAGAKGGGRPAAKKKT